MAASRPSPASLSDRSAPSASLRHAPDAVRLGRSVAVEGVVQGVGFRPFVWRLARELGLDGRVWNAAGRVEVEVAGEEAAVRTFATRLRVDAPPRARVERVEVRPLDGPLPSRGSGFVIVESVAAPSVERLFPPDIATCDDCLRELFDPADRRYRYPFTNCTNCGPRATIIEDLPYDRDRTSMREFPLCEACSAEYRDPADRRFHAEPVACPECGPRLSYRRTGDPAPVETAEAALRAATAAILDGRIVAIKGLGGYQLACDATDAAAVARLRDRKRRWAKPFAVMVRDLAAARRLARLSAAEASLLTSPARPIVLAPLRAASRAPDVAATPVLAPGVVSGNRRVGLFLPYTPLHHLLLDAIGGPIVLTSGNLSDEPIVTDDEEALIRLGAIADAFLQHDRRILARYDDSVTRITGRGPLARESIVRRARGYAPESVALPLAIPDGDVVLACGAELKHTFTIASRGRAHVAPHIGDLEDLLTHRAFEQNLAHLARLLDLEPAWAAHDLHPAYLSTQYAAAHFPADRRLGIQHHHAHVASCAAEHGIIDPFIGVAYDGLGMGDDGTFWGGEILVADLRGYRRVGRFGSAPMPGGALAVRKPYRMALGYLLGAERDGTATDAAWAARVEDLAGPAFLDRLDPREVSVVRVQLARELNAPRATSAGRLFDAAASLLGLRDVAEFEAQAAIDLEMAAIGNDRPLPYGVAIRDGLLVYDPRPTLSALLEGVADGSDRGRLAARFQSTIAEVTRELCREVAASTGLRTVCLSGGVFQNQWLTTTLLRALSGDGLEVHVNERVPVNDGGISYGQAAVAAAIMMTTTSATRAPLVPAGRTGGG
jgi:hydrogenase maturation protein HypF